MPAIVWNHCSQLLIINPRKLPHANEENCSVRLGNILGEKENNVRLMQ